MRFSSLPLLLLLLAFGQFAQALHQIEHVADLSEADCPICLRAQAADPQPTPSPSEPRFQLVGTAEPVGAVTNPPSITCPAWFARAPPSCSDRVS